MSTDRFEIHDDGPCIRIVSPDSTISTIVGRPVGYHIDDAVIGAIRQQARDLEIRNEWYANALNDLDDKRSEITKLRTDLAAAVAERDSTRRHAQDLTECAMKTIPADWRPGYAWTDDGVMNVLAEYVIELRQRAEQAEARLAAIEAAPTVAVVCSSHSFGQFVQQRFFGSQLPRIGTELIARPAKD